jgi:23S rRNA (adenine2503-C2)-methyltransferase
MTNNQALAGLGPQELRQLLKEHGQAGFRADQLFNWIHARRVFDLDQMSNLSLSLRKQLAESHRLFDLFISRRLYSTNSMCEKFLFELNDGALVEAVWMGFEKRSTLCVSTQVGCALECRFCATATMGLTRNLTASEIVQQVLCVHALAGRSLSNIVFMGMGEPLHNYDEVAKALSILNQEAGLALSRRRMTVSTAGLIPAIQKLADDKVPCKLAVSLNAAIDAKRTELMPINKRYPLAKLMEACRAYTDQTGERITFEYVMLDGVNDGDEDLAALRGLLSRLPCKLNLIRYHQAERGYTSSSEKRCKQFRDALRDAPFVVMIRQSMGTDIDAACGQLALKGEK